MVPTDGSTSPVTVKRRRFLAGLGAAGTGMAAGCLGGNSSGTTEFVTATSAEGSPAWNQGQAIQATVSKEADDLKFSAQQTSGYTANIGSLLNDEYDIIMTYTGLYDLASRGEEMFDEAHGTFGYFGPTLWGSEQLLVTREDTDVEYYEDIVGRNAATFPSGTGIYTFGRLFLETMGITEDDFNRYDIGLPDLASALQNERVVTSGFFSFHEGEVVSSNMQKMEAQNEVRPLQLREENRQAVEDNPALTVNNYTISGSEDFPDTEVPAYALLSPMILNEGLDTQPVKELCAVIVDNIDSIRDASPTVWDMSNPELLTKGLREEYPVHPGFAEFLQERGWWQDKWTVGE